MKLTLAPLPFAPNPQSLLAFYEQIADFPIDEIYLGETVCLKRNLMSLKAWITLGEQLQQQGKRVIFSTPPLVDDEPTLRWTAALIEQDLFPVEANDYTAASLAIKAGRAFYGGSSIMLYNAHSVAWMIAQGMQRWSVPIEVITPELKSLRETLTPLISSSCVPFELTVSGHPPLGYSARCFTARHHQRNREECKQICLQNAPLVISSLEHEPLFRINGTQLTSAHALACPSFLSSIVHPDTDLLRIIPHSLVPADLMTQLADVQSNLQSSL